MMLRILWAWGISWQQANQCSETTSFAASHLMQTPFRKCLICIIGSKQHEACTTHKKPPGDFLLPRRTSDFLSPDLALRCNAMPFPIYFPSHHISSVSIPFGCQVDPKSKTPIHLAGRALLEGDDSSAFQVVQVWAPEPQSCAGNAWKSRVCLAVRFHSEAGTSWNHLGNSHTSRPIPAVILWLGARSPTTTYRRKPTISSICLEPHAAFCKAFCGALCKAFLSHWARRFSCSCAFCLHLCRHRWPADPPIRPCFGPPNVTCVAWARSSNAVCIPPSTFRATTDVLSQAPQSSSFSFAGL